jgi:hypothetical protein
MGAATRAEVSNDGGFKSSKFFDLSNSKATVDWALESSREGTFTKIVYVRFWNCYGAPAFGSGSLTDDIILDNTKPVVASLQAVASTTKGGVAISRASLSATKTSSVRLSVRGSDSISGVGSIEVRSSARRAGTIINVGGVSGTVSSKVRSMSKSVVLSTSTKQLQVRLFDRAGNASPWKSIRVTG